MDKGKIIPGTDREGLKARYLKVKVSIPIEDYERGVPYFKKRKALNDFVVESYREKVNRAVANDKSARLRELMTNIEILEPVLMEMRKQGKLLFLSGGTD
jgi:hypothetical protein